MVKNGERLLFNLFEKIMSSDVKKMWGPFLESLIKPWWIWWIKNMSKNKIVKHLKNPRAYNSDMDKTLKTRKLRFKKPLKARCILYKH